MKLPIALLSVAPLLPFLTLANPITNPNPNPDAAPVPELDVRADKWCTLHSTVTSNINCRAGAGTGYRIVRQIRPGERFGVRCKAYGETIQGNRVWDWIPGWGCWVSAHYTNSGCENGVPWC